MTYLPKCFLGFTKKNHILLAKTFSMDTLLGSQSPVELYAV